MKTTEIGIRLKKLRESKKLSAREFGKIIGVSQSSISMYESGLRIPRDDLKIKISKFYGVSVESIFFTQ